MIYYIEVLTENDDGYMKLYDRVKVVYNGEYDSSKILRKFYKMHPEYDNEWYWVQISI